MGDVGLTFSRRRAESRVCPDQLSGIKSSIIVGIYTDFTLTDPRLEQTSHGLHINRSEAGTNLTVTRSVVKFKAALCCSKSKCLIPAYCTACHVHTCTEHNS